MKIVINSCFGGFGLSPLAVKRLAELQGKPCFFFTSEIKVGSPYQPITLEELQAKPPLIWHAFAVPNPDEVLHNRDRDWHSMTQKQRIAHNAKHAAMSLPTRPEKRDDPLLVQVVEELGEAANTRFSNLKVVEIPDGTDYEIDDYDGSETIHEKHQSWS